MPLQPTHGISSFLASLHSRSSVGTGSTAPRESPRYTFRAIRLFSPLTCPASRTIVDTAVRAGPDSCSGRIRAASLKFKNYPSPQPEIELSVQTRESSLSQPDRRQTPRTKLEEIAYIGMGPENGGLVLDVSDGGLSFHSVAPVQPAETIHFLLSSRGQNRIEGAGEVVWTNEMRTVCGLRFTSLSSGAREYLDNWTNQSRMSAPAREEAVSLAPPRSPANRGVTRFPFETIGNRRGAPVCYSSR